jgi:hypothetical protein
MTFLLEHVVGICIKLNQYLHKLSAYGYIAVVFVWTSTNRARCKKNASLLVFISEVLLDSLLSTLVSNTYFKRSREGNKVRSNALLFPSSSEVRPPRNSLPKVCFARFVSTCLEGLILQIAPVGIVFKNRISICINCPFKGVLRGLSFGAPPAESDAKERARDAPLLVFISEVLLDSLLSTIASNSYLKRSREGNKVRSNALLFPSSSEVRPPRNSLPKVCFARFVSTCLEGLILQIAPRTKKAVFG